MLETSERQPIPENSPKNSSPLPAQPKPMEAKMHPHDKHWELVGLKGQEEQLIAQKKLELAEYDHLMNNEPQIRAELARMEQLALPKEIAPMPARPEKSSSGLSRLFGRFTGKKETAAPTPSQSVEPKVSPMLAQQIDDLKKQVEKIDNYRAKNITHLTIVNEMNAAEGRIKQLEYQIKNIQQ